MKKMNRSQSSYRNCKTLITEQQPDNWQSKYASRHGQPKPNDLTSNSLLDKENNSLFQSVSQRRFHSKSSSRELSDCGHPDPQPDSLSMIEQLKRQLRAKQRQLQFVRQQSCSREEMDSLSSQVSCKLQREQKDKNLYIKELNNKTIEISHLQERVKLQRGEIDTLRMYLEEKEGRVAELEERLGQVDMRKKKLENYEFQLKESHQFLRELEVRTQRLKEETDAKDAVIQEKTASILALEQTLNSYEDKLRSIESSLLRITSDKRIMQEHIETLNKQVSHWKQNYEVLLQKSQAVQQIEIQLKTYASMVEDLNRRNTELTSNNEKYRIAAAANEKNTVKLAEAERELAALRRDNKEKEERLIELQGREKAHRVVEETNNKLKKEKEEILLKLQEKTKESKSLALQLEERNSRIVLLEQELSEMEESSERSKERGEKMDRLMRENNRLNAALMEKVNDIEKLQYRLNNLDNRFTNTQAELQRARVQLEESHQNEKALEVEVKDLRERYEAETSTRMQLEDKLVRSTQDLLAAKFALTKLAEEHAEQLQVMEKESGKVEEEIGQLKEELMQLETDKEETQIALTQAQGKIDSLRTEVGEFSWQLEEAHRREREHRAAVAHLEADLQGLTRQNDKLKANISNMKAFALKVREYNELILSE